MGCNSSKTKSNQDHKKLKGQNYKSSGPTNVHNLNDSFDKPLVKQDQYENMVADEWLNAIKNENLKEGSLVFPPDDLAKDTNMGITTKNN